MAPSNELNQILDEVEERANKASEGPWRFEKHWGPGNWQGAILHDTKCVSNVVVLPLETCTPERDANGSFIASARTDVPGLVKALREALKTLQDIAKVSNTNREHAWAQETIGFISAAILNQGRNKP